MGEKCVLCMFYIDWELGGTEENLRVGIVLNENLLGYGYRKQTTFSHGSVQISDILFYSSPEQMTLVIVISGRARMGYYVLAQ